NAFGDLALESNIHGSFNSAFGDDALDSVNGGDSKVGVGDEAGNSITDGSNNVCLGAAAAVGIVHASKQIAIGVPTARPFAGIGPTCFIGSIYLEPTSDAGTTHQVCVDVNNVISDCTAAAGKPQAMLDPRIEELQKQVEILTAQLKEQA